MWKHVVTETTFWKHTVEEAQKRNRTQNLDETKQDEMLRDKLYEELGVSRDIGYHINTCLTLYCLNIVIFLFITAKVVVLNIFFKFILEFLVFSLIRWFTFSKILVILDT